MNFNLPEIALHQILSSLPPGDAVRASLTSRQWRSAWISSPSLSFDERLCPLKSSDFFDHVDRSIALWISRSDARLTLRRLSLSAAIGDEEIVARIEPVLAFAAGRGVESVEIANQAGMFWPVSSLSNLWSIIFGCKSLEELSLRFFHFLPWNQFPSKLESVKRLSLDCNLFNEQTLSNLISCFPNLEDFELGFWIGPIQIRVVSTSLKSFSASTWVELSDPILIDAPNLRSFSYKRTFRFPGEIKFLNCRSLTSLTIDCVRFHTETTPNHTIQSYISQISGLEDLTLNSCRLPENVKIVHSHLKRLNMRTSHGIRRATFDTPNLRYFKYFSGVVLFDSFRYCSGLLEADIQLCTGSFEDTEWFWFVKLRNFLETFDKCRSIVLNCYVDGFPKELRNNDFLPDPFFGITHLTFSNPSLALEDCIHFVGAMVELFPCVQTLSIKLLFAIISIKYDESGSFTLQWVPTVGASDTAKYGVNYQFIREAIDELLEYLSWSDDDSEEECDNMVVDLDTANAF